MHRKHHAFTDVEGDPHSPVLHGWVKVQMLNVAMYRREASNPETVARYAKDLPQTTADRLFYDHALLGLGARRRPASSSCSAGRSACSPRSSTSTCTSAGRRP